MAKQILNVGTSNNDKTGDTLRAGGLKIKANFDEIYAALAQDGANISGGNLLKSGSYSDLRNKPDFANIATSGSYNDLQNKPNISTVVGAPTLLTGSSGDMIGNIAFDGNNLYVAIADYTDGQSNIWKYVPWGGSGTTQGYSYTHNQDPTSTGGFSLDNENPAQATVAYIATTDVDGNDIHPFYQYIFDNNLKANLEVISRTNPQNRALFKVDGIREMTANDIEYYEIDLVPIMSADTMTIGTGMWDLHFDFTGGGSSGSSLTNGDYTVELNAQGNLIVPQRLIIGGASSNYESHLEIDVANYWSSIQWTNLSFAQDPSATPFECHAQLMRVFSGHGEVEGHEELVAVSVVKPTDTTYNGLMFTTSDGKIPDAPYNDGVGTMYSWVLGGDGTISFPALNGNARTGSGNNLQFEKSNNQKIISTQNGTISNQTVERLVISGGDSYYDGTGYPSGEAGDIYLWAGRGYNGGDIKVDAGNSLSAQEGGTIKIRGGNSDSGIGGFVEIRAGTGGAENANIRLIAGGNQWTVNSSGTISMPPGGDILNSDGYSVIKSLPQNQQSDSADYTLQLSDAGKHVLKDEGGGYSVVVPTNATVAFPIGTVVTVVSGNSWTYIYPADGDTTEVWGAGYNQTSTAWYIPNNSMATLLKIGTDKWMLSGAGLAID
jgi:hypothetical protein